MSHVAAVVFLGTALLVFPPVPEPRLFSVDDSLWIAVVDERGILYPITRLVGESWEVPDWVKTFDIERENLAPDVPLDVPTHWFFYSPRHAGSPITTTGVRLASAHCMFKWTFTADSSGLGLSGQDRLAGVALSDAPQAALLEDDIAGLNTTSEYLGLTDSPPDSLGTERHRKFRWLGFFRIKGAVVGIVQGQYYEGESISVIGIDGKKGRLLASAHMGGC